MLIVTSIMIPYITLMKAGLSVFRYKFISTNTIYMEFVLICSLIVNFFFAAPEVKKLYLKFKNKNKQ